MAKMQQAEAVIPIVVDPGPSNRCSADETASY